MTTIRSAHIRLTKEEINALDRLVASGLAMAAWKNLSASKALGRTS